MTPPSQRPLLTIGIPAYNRAAQLPALLDSITAQDFADYECIVAEDCSPEREAIRAVVACYAAAHPGKFRFHANPTNLGYDGNLRQLIALARGRYVMLMGNDDLVAEGAFRAVAEGIAKHGEVGAILRAYTFFREDPSRPEQVNRFYPSERLIPAGRAAILACYRRFVAVSGIVLHRDSAAAVATDAYDGMVFYQLWAASACLAERPALYLPTILAHFRRGGTPEFGSSAAEREHFTPGTFTLPQQVQVVRGFFAVAEAVERQHKLPGLAEEIRRDFGRYSYHTLSHFAKDGRRALWAAYRAFGEFGLRRSWWYHAWFVLLFVLGARLTDRVIQLLRRTLGFTPNLTRTPA